MALLMTLSLFLGLTFYVFTNQDDNQLMAANGFLYSFAFLLTGMVFIGYFIYTGFW